MSDLREALEAIEPYLDAITCYASTVKEHEGNRVAALVRAAIASPQGDGDVVAWRYELALAIDADENYSSWRWYLTQERPTVNEKSIRNLTPLYAQPQNDQEAVADWSVLPKDIYVTSARRVNNVGFDVQCCSVPMVMVPEVRYVRSDMIAAPTSEERTQVSDRSALTASPPSSRMRRALEQIEQILSDCGGDFHICPQCNYQDNNAIHESDLRLLIKDVFDELSRAGDNHASDTTIPSSDDMDARFAWLEAKAIDMGYVLVAAFDPENPDKYDKACTGRRTAACKIPSDDLNAPLDRLKTEAARLGYVLVRGDREAIARIIDPVAKFDDGDGIKWGKFEIQQRELAYQKADRILALQPRAGG